MVLALPQPVGLKFEDLEHALKTIGSEQNAKGALDPAEFLVELGLAYKLPPPPQTVPALPPEPFRDWRSFLQTAAAGAEVWVQSGQRSKNFRLTTEGFTAYNARFVLFQDELFKEIMRQKIAAHPTVERILGPFRGGSTTPVEGLKNHLAKEFHDYVSIYDINTLTKFLQHYELVEVTGDEWGFQPQTMHVLNVVRRNPLDAVPGWPRVQIELLTAQQDLNTATNPNEFEKVGHQCREVLISLAQVVYDQEHHPPIDDKTPSDTDAKRMLEAVIAADYTGAANQELRKMIRAAVDVANKLQHNRTADRTDATFCLEATTSVVQMLAILKGQL